VTRTPIKLHTLTAEEVTEIKRLASSHKAPIRLVQRARIIAYILEEGHLYASDAGLKAGFMSTVSEPVWVCRFNEKGIAGLEDQPRRGRQPTYGIEVHSQLVSLAIQKPKSLGYPFSGSS
jgi:transposase